MVELARGELEVAANIFPLVGRSPTVGFLLPRNGTRAARED
eukprot:CAMPEP_0206452612 /NCGR_PEP_ID=MMETSP0324_2-20121206/20052_1 /ASSEMBLY_ACC=CAM_ASM_000836 /TAXON_ID=2866 /ORGANISM="Crypthecodinium cohnii, Strain Seligo" /LENGTH=40 /DNA_ID= /DNA_START= /DNA_END= /DNA_ORIENTATION=